MLEHPDLISKSAPGTELPPKLSNLVSLPANSVLKVHSFFVVVVVVVVEVVIEVVGVVVLGIKDGVEYGSGDCAEFYLSFIHSYIHLCPQVPVRDLLVQEAIGLLRQEAEIYKFNAGFPEYAYFSIRKLRSFG